ncbi:hypothetical protein [Polaromonas jejuensis]|uniref:Uncharacterized protein n=1 Tax=Polaromonas jejuensis TaxID=457502 RepID=A0ABW0QA93_9BURK|nr:hypothetical protein [Polaromonas jejuensis]
MTSPAAIDTVEELHRPRVRLLGSAYSARAFEIRDFLSRSVVTYDWVELDEAAARRILGIRLAGSARELVVARCRTPIETSTAFLP